MKFLILLILVPRLIFACPQIEVQAQLRKTIKLKTLALDFADRRAGIWMKHAERLEGEVHRLEELRKNKWVYYGLGAITTLLVGLAVHRVARIDFSATF